jgi:putative ABC transport system permease protein
MLIPALTRKLLRDLWHLRGQCAAISLVLAAGIAMFVMAVNMLLSLGLTQETYYDRHRFAEVFAHVKRAPDPVADRIRDIPGVASVDTRVVEHVTLDIPGMVEPATGRMVSIAADQDRGLNRLYLREGRMIEYDRSTEVLLSEAFAQAHQLRPGDRLTAILNGRKQELQIIGIALSPEYIYQLPEGEVLPDDRQFGVIWMGKTTMESVFNMEGGFNDLCLTLLPETNEQAVIDQVDSLLAPYGGIDAYGREDQQSHEFVSNEIEELRGMAMVVPTIFLAVAAVLLNVVIGRLIDTQREQIAALKAFGYSNRAVGQHYAGFVFTIVLLGTLLGIGVGVYLGRGLTEMYTAFFHFPVLIFKVDGRVSLAAAGIALLAGALATYSAVRRVVSLPPAEAMRPEPPASYRPTFLERIGFQRLLSAPARMVLRQLERRWGKSAVTCMGIATAAAVLVLGSFSLDSVNYLMDTLYRVSQRQDISVNLVENDDTSVLYEIAQLPGVRQVEGFRAVPVRISHENKSRRLAIIGIEPDAELYRVVDDQNQTVPLSDNGLVISVKLAEVLGVEAGDEVIVHALEGERPTRQLPIAGTVSDFGGINAYMPRAELNRFMREGNIVSGAHVSADAHQADALYEALKQTPHVAGVVLKESALKSFQDIVAESQLRMRLLNIGFACVIAFGVVYNAVRISLSERGRELATLRVIGFTRTEVSTILLGELAVLTVVAIPLGLAIGYALSWIVVETSYDTELFRIPLVIGRQTYAFAASVVLAAAVISGLLVRRRIDRLDLVSVLKSRE